MNRTRIRGAIRQIGAALREPEDFALSWDQGTARYEPLVWFGLAFTAIVGTTTYGMTMGMLGGVREIFLDGFRCTLAAGLAWGVPLPALYILNSLSGSRLRLSTTFLLALVTTSWGGLAMIAAIPVNWFVSAALPDILSPLWVGRMLLLLNLAVFAAVGVAMIDVFGRVAERVEPSRGRTPVWWLLIVGAIGGELYAFGLFEFGQA